MNEERLKKWGELRRLIDGGKLMLPRAPFEYPIPPLSDRAFAIKYALEAMRERFKK